MWGGIFALGGSLISSAGGNGTLMSGKTCYTDFPPNNGFISDPIPTTLEKGQELIRYGGVCL